MSLIENNILYEDNHLIAVNKTCGQLVQGDYTGDIPLSELAKSFLKTKYNKPGKVYLGVCHRLDRPVSGVVLFAKTSKALTRLNNMFRDKTIQKSYLAIVDKSPYPDKGELFDYLLKNTDKNKSFVVKKDTEGAKKASLDYELIAKKRKYYLLKVNLHTGRHHQIRAQLASINCEIIGDLKYGYKQANANSGINLHAYKLSFTHPVKQTPIEIIAKIPDDEIWNTFKDVLS